MKYLERLQENIDNLFPGKDINEIIQDHIPFIIKSITETTGRYVCMDNSDEFSIGLLGFHEALEKYVEGKGHFLPFAKLVISSRIKNHLIKGNRDRALVSMEELTETGIEISEEYVRPKDDKGQLIEEIQELKIEINKFGFGFDQLVDESPKHKDTRERTISLSKNVSKEKDFMDFMYEKFRLPIKKISERFSVTEKVIKGNKKFIISVVIIFFKNYRNLKLWIRS